VTSMRGKASRRIIRERVKKLQQQGVLLKNEGKPPTYELVKQADQ
jgi:DNA-binding FadR family transcriptional regulator